jgi:hypothetical protein
VMRGGVRREMGRLVMVIISVCTCRLEQK